MFTDKQIGGMRGALLTNLSAWLSGVWFDFTLVGVVFKKISYALPFVHALDMERAALAGDFAGFFLILGGCSDMQSQCSYWR